MDSIPLHATLFRQVENDGILMPLNIIYFDSTLTIRNGGRHRGGQDLLYLIDLRNNHVSQGIPNGNGPKEILTLGSLKRVDSLIYAYDIPRKVVYVLNLNESRRRQDIIYDEYYRISTEQHPFRLHKLNDGFLAIGLFFDEGAFMRINMNTNQYEISGQYPEFQSTDRLSNLLKSMLYNGTRTSVKPDQTRFVYAPNIAGYLAIYSLADDIRLIKETKYFEPIFVGAHSDYEQPRFTKDTKLSACDIASTDEYIYLLYSGKTLEINKMVVGDYLLVYDWDGNPVRYYKLDVPLSSMDIDFENKTIYGVAYNPEGMVVKYELPE
jgi:hypothetical protein